jgi:hypothetical protein
MAGLVVCWFDGQRNASVGGNSSPVYRSGTGRTLARHYYPPLHQFSLATHTRSTVPKVGYGLGCTY